ncbi:MAG: hypothetical protein JRD05_12990 [Deltaproteobacteria bacterium]|nr:hypothetical protein [Deltaproteobacteria bacterium]
MNFLLDTNITNDYNITKQKTKGGDLVERKAWTLRMPKEILEWGRIKAAKETIKRNEVVSINTVFVEILTKAMEADKKKGG